MGEFKGEGVLSSSHGAAKQHDGLSGLSRLTDQAIPYGNENLPIKCVKIIAKQIETVLQENSGKEG